MKYIHLSNLKHAAFLVITWLFITLSPQVMAQHPETRSVGSSRISATPESVLRSFRDDGMAPVEHELNSEEISIVNAAFNTLPILHQRILKERLEGISFLDNMPNTALTSRIKTGDSVERFHITFRAAILHQTISQWLKEKELTCFANTSADTVISFDAGDLNAIIYVLLHETTHVVDASIDIFNDLNSPFATQFLKGVWTDRTTLLFKNEFLTDNNFHRNGQVYPIVKAPLLYQALQKTPLVSLYSTNSRNEDLAECLTIYHLTQNLKQPFKMFLTAGGKTILVNDPVKRKEVWNRMKALSVFYENG